MMYGPNTNLRHNSIVFMIQCQVHYIVRCLLQLPQLSGLDGDHWERHGSI
jgi:hypothetical protein